jgi:cell division protein FtsB
MANRKNSMTLKDIITDIHALTEDIEVYERKYGVLSETFYESFINGEEPEDDSWVLDWSDWAGAYKILLRRQEQYRRTIHELRQENTTIVDVIERTAQREPIPIAS